MDVTGTATVGDDFVLTDASGVGLSSPDQLTLEAGAVSTSLRVAAATDAVADDGETVVLVVLHGASSVGVASITLLDPNERLAVTGAHEFTHPENDTAVGTFTASDAEDDTVTWSLAGDDASLFDIAAGELRFGSPPDFETPADVGADNVYDVTVQASDDGGVTGHAVTVTVTDVDEAATIASDSGSFVVAYDEHDTAAVAAFVAEDPEGATIRWSLGGDGRRRL